MDVQVRALEDNEEEKATGASDEVIEEEYEEEFDELEDFEADDEDPAWWLPYVVLITLLIIGMLGFFGAFNPWLVPAFNKMRTNAAPATSASAAAAPAPAKPERPAVPAPAKKPQRQMFGASHILVSYKGSRRAKPAITRTKDEAKKRADEITAKAKKDPNKFADLAKEFSDGPSGPRGGALGMFPKGAMHPKFQEGVEKAKVGGVVGPVETPFGYHVIKRTK